MNIASQWEQFLVGCSPPKQSIDFLAYYCDQCNLASPGAFFKRYDTEVEVKKVAAVSVAADIPTHIRHGSIDSLNLENMLLKGLPKFEQLCEEVGSRLITAEEFTNKFKLPTGKPYPGVTVVSRDDSEVSCRREHNKLTQAELKNQVLESISGKKKCVAAFVSGCSGSGKSIFAERILPELLFEEEERHLLTIQLRHNKIFPQLGRLQEIEAMSLEEKKACRTERNSAAVEGIRHLVKEQVLGDLGFNRELPETSIVKNLVVVVDEIGNCLGLARGVAACAADHCILPFAENVFFIFCGTSVEYAADELEGTTEATEAGRLSANTKLTHTVTGASLVITIVMKEASDAFWDRLGAAVPHFSTARCTLHSMQAPLLDALTKNTRAGSLLLQHLHHGLYINRDAEQLSRNMQAEILHHIGVQYTNLNGLARAKGDPKHFRFLIRKTLQFAFSEELPATEEMNVAREIVRLGLLREDNGRLEMSVAITAMCLCMFGLDPAPAVDWTSFESLCFSYWHLQFLSEGKTVRTLVLSQPFPAVTRASSHEVFIDETLDEAIPKVRSMVDTTNSVEPDDDFVLLVQNAPLAPFADIFAIDGKDRTLKLIQCKRYKESSSFTKADYIAELLKCALLFREPDDINGTSGAAVAAKALTKPVSRPGNEVPRPLLPTEDSMKTSNALSLCNTFNVSHSSLMLLMGSDQNVKLTSIDSVFHFSSHRNPSPGILKVCLPPLSPLKNTVTVNDVEWRCDLGPLQQFVVSDAENSRHTIKPSRFAKFLFGDPELISKKKRTEDEDA